MRPSFYLVIVATVWASTILPYCFAEGREPRRKAYLSAESAGRRTVASVLDEIGGIVVPDVREKFEDAGAVFPPRDLVFIALKEERKLEVWSRSASSSKPVRITSYRVLAASGTQGPKLKQGDQQVPEGFYKITGLNPNSAFHLSLRVNYPNSEDLMVAKKEGRRNLGGDIYIHGDRVSAGCLAMGDAAIEEIFVMASYLRPATFDILIAPYDFRRKSRDHSEERPWVQERYKKLKVALADYVLRD